MPKVGPETKFHQKFRSRVEYLVQHVELVTASVFVANRSITLARASGAHSVKANATVAELLTPGEERKYPVLGKLPARDWTRFQKFSVKLNLEYALHLMYTHFEEYAYSVRDSFPESATSYPGIAWGEQKIRAGDLVGSSPTDVNKALGRFVKASLKALKSGRELFEQTIEACKLTIDADLQSKALLALDVRNTFVHGQKTVSKNMVNKNKGLVKSILGLEAGGTIVLSAEMVRELMLYIVKHVADVDRQLIKNGVVDAR